jgi:hypothetical protein
MLVAVAVLAAGCARHTVPPAVPTVDPIADDAVPLADLETPEYHVEVYLDGSVRWRGIAGVQSIGERHGRLPPETVTALIAAFDDAKFVAMPDSESWKDGCGEIHPTKLWFQHGGVSNAQNDGHCPQDPTLLHLERRFAELVGLDQWIHGNPAPAGGPVPDGEHLIVTLRSACSDECTDHEMTVFDDGTVVSNGLRTATLSPAAIDELIAAIDAAKVWTLPPASKVYCTDGVSLWTTFQRGERHHTYYDDQCDPEHPLTRLEREIERIVTAGVLR